ncbi:MTH1187 family thiamine-binding protein [Desulfonatronum thioautotrophicum]|uniref:MTH1187 family thiamine-binding protein n=1 Tax=Desulfonatronum thioautotrophicum TaxID=617001 RepID=UPI001FC91763|nr:MTH1187 family thiamine-binding protein [Desulfonatronum thioautotrophicum]
MSTESESMNVLAELSIFPMDKGESLAPFVARAVAIIQQSGQAYQFGPMSTVVEGRWDQVMDVVTSCQQDLAADCDRILVYLRLDCRRNRKDAIQSKVRSVETRLSRK